MTAEMALITGRAFHIRSKADQAKAQQALIEQGNTNSEDNLQGYGTHFGT